MELTTTCWRTCLVVCLTLVVSLIAAAPAAHASCVSGSESIDSADTAFEGVAKPGPASADGALLSPARFKVTGWVKGDGPAEVEVPTAVQQDKGSGMLMKDSVGITPSPAERWLVMLRDGSPGCTGSRLLTEGETVGTSESSSGLLVGGGLVALAVLAGAAWASRRQGPAHL
jgi:hypothetical protein